MLVPEWLESIEIGAGSRLGKLLLANTVPENGQLVSGMLAELPAGAVQHDYQLVALRENSNQTITLSFDSSGGIVDVVAGLVALALPFSTLRNADLSRSNLSPTKQMVIQTLGMGSNAKMPGVLMRITGRWILGFLAPTPITRLDRPPTMVNSRLPLKGGFISLASTPLCAIRVSRGGP